MRRISLGYLDGSIIPMLCRKAGIPIDDVRGRITSHRARSTIASQLFNAKEPMTLFELQEWLGHSSPEATQHYVKITPTKLAKSYVDAGYFARNVRAIEVLIYQESVRKGRPSPSRGSSTISAMAIALMISSSSVRTAWHARNARSTSRRNRRHRLC
jgi:hypothetical protein